MLRPSQASLQRFTVLMFLSVVVATVGLLQNSAAVVVGAMMIAPLMTPIMGMAASLVMGWGRRLLFGVVVVTLSVTGAVAVSWAIATFLPAADTGLPSEVLARSNPDVRDLMVALAAGAAGAYATIRKDVSGALPGVAVAVALVPPLGSVGVLSGRGQPDLAQGAGLLFATNLFGIVLAAAVVFVVTGFVPAHRIRLSQHRVLAVLAIILVPPLVIGVILTGRFVDAADRARELRVATQVVQGWLGSRDELDRVMLSGSTVQVNVTGEGPLPPLTTLTESLQEQLGHPTTVDLRWTRVRSGAAEQPARPPFSLDEVRPVVEEWLSEQSLTLDGLSYDSTGLVVEASGTRSPKDADELITLIGARFGTQLPINLAWTEEPLDDAGPSPGVDSSVLTARSVADTWAQAHPGTAVLAVDQSADAVTVTIIGSVRPDVDDLKADLSAALPQVSVTVQWVSGSILSHSEPTPSPAPSPNPNPSPGPSPSPGPNPSPGPS